MVRKALHEEMTSELTVVMEGGPTEEQGVSFGCWKMVNMTIVTKKGHNANWSIVDSELDLDEFRREWDKSATTVKVLKTFVLIMNRVRLHFEMV